MDEETKSKFEEWGKFPSVGELRKQTIRRALSDWMAVTHFAHSKGNVKGLTQTKPWRLGYDCSLYATFVLNGVKLTVNDSGTDPDESRWEWNASVGTTIEWGYLYELKPEHFQEIFGTVTKDQMRFLNVTDACLKHIGAYWEDDKGRSVEQFIQDCLSEHGDGFGPIMNWKEEAGTA